MLCASNDGTDLLLSNAGRDSGSGFDVFFFCQERQLDSKPPFSALSLTFVTSELYARRVLLDLGRFPELCRSDRRFLHGLNHRTL